MPEKVDKFTKDENIVKLLLALAIPSIISGMVDNLYNTVDSIFVGQFVGGEGLAALSVINVIQLMYISMAVLFGVGNGSVVSRALGARNEKRAELSLVHSFWTLLCISSVISFSILANLDSFLSLIGASERTLPYAKSYGSIILWTGFLLPINGMMLGAFRARGEALKSTYLMVTGAVTNIFLDAVFIMMFGWGVAGAAIATACSQLLVFVLAITRIKKLYNTNFLLHDKSEIDLHLVKEIIQTGLPTGLRLILFVFTHSVANGILVNYGDEYISAFGIFNRFIMILSIINICLGGGAQPLIGMNYGARLFDRVKRIIVVALKMGMWISVFTSAFLWFAPEGAYRLFTLDPNIIRACREISVPQSYTYIGWGIFICVCEAAQAMGHAKESFWVSISYPLITMFGFIVFNYFWGLTGVLWAFPFAYLIIGIESSALLMVEFRRLDKRMLQE